MFISNLQQSRLVATPAWEAHTASGVSVCIWREIRRGSLSRTRIVSRARRWLEIKANIFPRVEELDLRIESGRTTTRGERTPSLSHQTIRISLSLSLSLDRLFLTLTSGPCWDETMRFPLCAPPLYERCMHYKAMHRRGKKSSLREPTNEKTCFHFEPAK